MLARWLNSLTFVTVIILHWSWQFKMDAKWKTHQNKRPFFWPSLIWDLDTNQPLYAHFHQVKPSSTQHTKKSHSATVTQGAIHFCTMILLLNPLSANDEKHETSQHLMEYYKSKHFSSFFWMKNNSVLQEGITGIPSRITRLLVHNKYTHRSGRVSKINLQVTHCFDDGHNGLNGVAINHCFVLPAFLFWVSILMDDPGRNNIKCQHTEGQSLPWISLHLSK